eukprot:TRINITY_DN28147_c0_g2_i1.p1 TRINITY_DN28147_c0_g2~~TRINITY_DN28147_c0_g2_i1.p1  ORF type:complete len:437 (-),score=58.75 TRINITY_DN28147_c0_g2_i1:68-1378(-)
MRPIKSASVRAAPSPVVRAKWNNRSLQTRATSNTKHNTATPSLFTRRQQLATVSLLAALANDNGAQAAPKTVFVAGSTGNTGKRVVQELRARGVNVIAGVRDVKKAQSLGWGMDKGITIRTADVTKSPQELAEALKGADAVICAIGGGAVTPFDNRAKKVDNEGTQHLIQAAKMAGVSSFVLMSSLLTNAKALGEEKNANYVVLQFFGGVLEEKLKAEKYLRGSGLQWTIVRPGGLSNDEPESVGNIIVGGEDRYLAKDEDPGRSISRTSVAQYMVEALYNDVLWRIRGWMDKIVGGPGLRRGRRHPQEVAYGEALDFWRVIAVDSPRRLHLLAEMKLPGQAALEFCIDPNATGDRSTLHMTARFKPKGLLGLAYWYSVLPLHHFVFNGMLNGMKRTSEQIAESPAEPAPTQLPSIARAAARARPRSSVKKEKVKM